MVQVVRGMRDLIGKDALIQEAIETRIEQVAVSYGYLPQYTPAVENFELFKTKGAAGEAIKDEIYYFKDKGDRELALRFEFTSSLARIAANNQLKMPYKRYQIGEVYRYDRPQAKRYRAFNQADLDILGVKGLEAELEIMFIVRDSFEALGLKPKVVFNSRKLLNDLLQKYAKGKEVEAMRILDKMDKVDKAGIKEMLAEKDIDGEVVDIIEEGYEKITQIVGQAASDRLPRNPTEASLNGESEGVKEVNDFLDLCKENSLDFVEFDAKLARGFEYYTGIVFEVKLDKGPSVGGGGRFDKLIEKYGGQETPAVGIGLGISRIFDYLKENGFKIGIEGVFLTGISIESKELFKIADSLRKEGIFCEIDLKGMKPGKALNFAEKKGYNFVGIIGENELKENKITVKNLKSGKQETIPIKEVKVFLSK